MVLRFYMLFYLLVFVLVAFVWPTWRTWKSTGIYPVTFKRTDSAHDYVGMVMKVIILLLAVVVVCYLLHLEHWLLPVHYLVLPPVRIAGMLMLHVSLIWIAIAQYQMGNSWRIGIDERHRTELKTSGLFSVSRNPVFAGMLCSVTGMFLVYPDALMCVIVCLTYVTIQVQIRLEEAFLRSKHGDKYRVYCSKVRRLI